MTMISPWGYTRRSYWYPMTAIEQSLDEMSQLMEKLTSDIIQPRSFSLTLPENTEEEEFFEDLPVSAKRLSLQPKEVENKYSSYSYSTSTILDKNGKKINSMRRRYEDSRGRLKAIHTRRIGDNVLKKVWTKQNKDDQGDVKIILSSGTEEEFEKMWKETPFAKKAEEKSIEPETKKEASKIEDKKPEEMTA